eukprot:CAMPEP_0197658932 /NCGR_PEP_ID=MMETSP1338-20131121/45538_1 /TAXON_ID=43686 ORGANISM="Pelagodinium beii, Strain RCC1491" /NCGR_SAMPLE_ID=MMETSP1338 /ASSEMBLY_ACC=CAM_ASM_000754 /LENGTH=465 /DNA_ID=CAMNT_0043235625 /DNA_START=55 /DNA_END=1452 /DNA_ORIENTATION=-
MAAKDRPVGPEFPGHLKVIKQIGRGAYGTVHLCEDTSNGKQVAVKHVKQAARHGKSMIREIRLLARLRHENLLHLLDFPAVASENFEDIFLVLPYLAADLHKVIQSQQALTEKHVQVIIVQIFRALAYLHASGVAHRDLKPANILLSTDCKLKICDFGLARGGLGLDGEEPEEAFGVLTEYVVTRWYRAPEVMLLPKQYSTSVDIWAVGCILGEILGRKALIPGKNHIDMVCKVAQIIGSPKDSELQWLPKNTDAYRFLKKVCPQTSGTDFSTLYPRASPACLDLMASILRWDPGDRLSAADAQKHEYLKAFLPREAPPPPEPFDWTFDGFRPTAEAVKERLYHECARYHPEILERDRAPRLGSRGYASGGMQPRSLPGQEAGYPNAQQAQVMRMPRPVAVEQPAYHQGKSSQRPSQVPGQQPPALVRAATPVRAAAAAGRGKALTPRQAAAAGAAARGVPAVRV